MKRDLLVCSIDGSRSRVQGSYIHLAVKRGIRVGQVHL